MKQHANVWSTVWRRHQIPWNWLVQALGGLLLLLAFWQRGAVEAWAGAGLILAGALDFHLPPFPENTWAARLVWRMIRAEVVWINSPWNRRKRIGAVYLTLGSILVLLAFWASSLPGLGLTVGFLVLLRVRVANKDAGIDP
ncbi:hypothetical protein [Paucidesulfovibrio longus]|uniref:hypothetical protein n=1 Tax=Paucidesulfovibrio longus TaxID=889 RepID=UPI0003B65520|nr:hypothetical protein [Paucidesulfovibrio longus]